MEVGVYHHIAPLNFLSENRIKAYIKCASELGIEIFFFDDSVVDTESRSIIGSVNMNGQWRNKKYNYPEILINESGLSLEEVTEIGKELRKEIPFNNNSISSFVRLTHRIREEEKFNEYIEDVKDSNFELSVWLFRNSSGEWEVGSRTVTEKLIVNNHLKNKDYESFSINRFGSKSSFYNFYLNNLSFDLAKHINSFYKREISELMLSFGINEDNKFKLINATTDIPNVENELERALTVLAYSKTKVLQEKINEKITVGMLVKTEKNPSIFKKYNNMKFACASVATIRGLNFFFFTPSDINYNKKNINGYVYDKKGVLTRKTFSYPDAIIDRFRMKGVAEYERLYTEFASIPFNNEREGGAISKSETYDIISNSEIYSDFLIPYKEVTCTEDIVEFLMQYKKIILKPSVGSFGDDIIYIEEKGLNQYVVKLNDEKNNKDMEQLLEFINFYSDRPMVVQEFIVSQTQDGAPFDVRIHILKDDVGKWNIANIYPRIGSIGGLTSNLSGGGSTSTWAKFFRHEFPEYEWKDFNKELMEFSKGFAEFFQEHLDSNVNEIAIDIGIDRNKVKLVFFEVNANIPGCRFHTLEAAFYIVSYIEYLVKEKRKTVIKESIENSMKKNYFYKVLA